MIVTRKTDAPVSQAEQWTGTLDSLLAVQRLLVPTSPLYDHTANRDLGIYINKSLAWVAPGQWILRMDQTIEILDNATFLERYVEVSNTAALQATMRGTVQGTHPRLLELHGPGSKDLG